MYVIISFQFSFIRFLNFLCLLSCPIFIVVPISCFTRSIQVAVHLVGPSPFSFILIFQTWTNVMIIRTIVKLEVSVWILLGVTAASVKKVTRSVMEEATALVRGLLFRFLSFTVPYAYQAESELKQTEWRRGSFYPKKRSFFPWWLQSSFKIYNFWQRTESRGQHLEMWGLFYILTSILRFEKAKTWPQGRERDLSRPSIHWFVHWFASRSSVRSFVGSPLVRWFVHSSIRSFVHSFIRSSIRLFILSFAC